MKYFISVLPHVSFIKEVKFGQEHTDKLHFNLESQVNLKYMFKRLCFGWFYFSFSQIFNCDAPGLSSTLIYLHLCGVLNENKNHKKKLWTREKLKACLIANKRMSGCFHVSISVQNGSLSHPKIWDGCLFLVFLWTVFSSSILWVMVVNLLLWYSCLS